MNLLEVRNLKRYFEIKGGILHKTIGYVYAVNDVSLTIEPGKTVGLVGESGCGKTTLGKVIMRFIPATSGEVLFEGINLFKLRKKEMKNKRRNMQMVFQDPQSSLNPRLTVKSIVGEPLIIYGVVGGGEVEDRVLDLLTKVGLIPDHLNRFPHEFSGGQRQRIGIARALALNPKFIILDEPTSSLDVSVRAQILNLLKDLKRDLRLTYLFISHNLSVVKHMSDKIAVMYLGKIVEFAKKKKLFESGVHPYTEALLRAIPEPNPDLKRDRVILKGDVPSSANPPPGCTFHTRCPFAQDTCKKEVPKLVDIGGGHLVACHRVDRM